MPALQRTAMVRSTLSKLLHAAGYVSYIVDEQIWSGRGYMRVHAHVDGIVQETLFHSYSSSSARRWFYVNISIFSQRRALLEKAWAKICRPPRVFVVVVSFCTDISFQSFSSFYIEKKIALWVYTFAGEGGDLLL